MQTLSGWETGNPDEEADKLSRRYPFIDVVRELRYALERNRRIHGQSWSNLSAGAETVREQAALTPREASLLHLFQETGYQLSDVTAAIKPGNQSVTKDKLPQDLYQRWQVAAMLLLALWKEDPEILDLAMELEADPDALSRVGLTRDQLPPLLRKRLIQAPAFLLGPAPPHVKGLLRYYQSGINRSLVADVLHGKGEFSFASVRALQERLAANLPPPATTPPSEIIPDEPPLTVETLQERVDAIRRHWRENGIEDDIWLF